MKFSLCKYIQCHDVSFGLKWSLGVINWLGHSYVGTPYFGTTILAPTSSVPQVTVPDTQLPHNRHNQLVPTYLFNILVVYS